ncbi:MAG: methyl-accepting chemotaxis protein [Nitrospirae bacterium]|nr:methyl-accepting chemotaxis protein [Nitrospirota bacterium]MBI5694666.1 methyl-accepting chemotaxis protein [Nitrospirota bacterium]
MPDKKLFLSFGFRIFLYLLLGIALSDLLFYYTTDHSLGETYYDALVVLEVARQTSMLFIFSVSSFIYIVALVMVFLASIVMSHRISGPMYRLKRCAESVARGDLTTRAVLRDGDQLMPQAEKFNKAVGSLHDGVALCSSRAEGLMNLSYKLEGALGSGECAGEKAGEIIEEMNAAAGEMSLALSRFKNT